MKVKNWRIITAIIFLLLSIIFYFIHYLIFHDAHHIFIYLIGDIAFVFIEVILVTLIIHQLLNQWEKNSHLKKLNMVIEVFFSEFGREFLIHLAKYDNNFKNISKYFDLNTENNTINNILKEVKKYKADLSIDKIDLKKLKKILLDKRFFIMNLLQNPNLLEHEAFTETIMAIFHIAEELKSRNLDKLSKDDISHTKKDIERAYNLLAYQWINYMKYIKENYPYFYLFAVRTNPFNILD